MACYPSSPHYGDGYFESATDIILDFHKILKNEMKKKLLVMMNSVMNKREMKIVITITSIQKSSLKEDFGVIHSPA